MVSLPAWCCLIPSSTKFAIRKSKSPGQLQGITECRMLVVLRPPPLSRVRVRRCNSSIDDVKVYKARLMGLGLGTCLLHNVGYSADNVRTSIAAAETTHDASIKTHASMRTRRGDKQARRRLMRVVEPFLPKELSFWPANPVQRSSVLCLRSPTGISIFCTANGSFCARLVFCYQ